VCSPMEEDLDIVPAGQGLPNPSSSFGSNRMKEFVEKAKEKYDLIVFSTPPLSLFVEGSLVSSISDCSFLGVSLGETRKETLRSVLQNLFTRHGELSGLILFGATRNNSLGVFPNTPFGKGNGLKNENLLHKKTRSQDKRGK